MSDDPAYELDRPAPIRSGTGDSRIGLLSNKDGSGLRITTAIEPISQQRGRHSRGGSNEYRIGGEVGSQSTAYEPYAYTREPPTPKSREYSEPVSASSLLRRFTTKYVPNISAGKTKRSQGRQYATLGDGDNDQIGVDISSLEGIGWELNDMSAPDSKMDLHDQDATYGSPTAAESSSPKPTFKSFVDKRKTVGDGMNAVGVQLRRDPTRRVSRMTSESRGGMSSGVDRTKTVRDIGQKVAQEKNMIVEVEEHVDLSSLEGLTDSDSRAGVSFDTMSLNGRANTYQETKSYFFPEDPDIPNWRPFSMSRPYIMLLTLLALGLGGFQEYLCQRSISLAREDSGILVFNEVSSISTIDFFAWKYLPTMITIIYAVLFSIMDFDIRRLEPYYQLSQPKGAPAAASLNLDHLTMFQYFIPFKAFHLRQWAVLFSTTGNILSSMIAPALQNPSVTFDENPECQPNGCRNPNNEFRYWVRIDPIWSRLLSASYFVVAIITVVLFIQLGRKSGLLSDPKGIAGIASMATKSHILQDFSGLDEATRGQIHKKLQHRRYILYKSSIWQGEWSASSEPVIESQKRLGSPHPPMLQAKAAIPFLIFQVVCLVSVPIITLTPARVIPDKLPWLPILVATLLKLLFSTFEADVRLMEPFYQLSRGNAKPQNSLTLDYQSTLYGWIFWKALFNKHYLVSFVGFCSVSLDVLTVTVSSFSVDSDDFLRNPNGQDISNGDETFVSFWVSFILSVVILMIVISTTWVVFMRRRHPFLPREPSTIAAVLAFIYASNMLMDFIDTETLDNQSMEKRLKNLGKTYALGWFKGRDGRMHCAIDEEPMRSKYVHGKPYSMALSGPLQPQETFYTV